MIGQKKDKDPENCPLIKDLNFPKARLSLRVRPAPFRAHFSFQQTFCFTLYLLPPLLNPFLTNQARTRDSSPHCWPCGPVLRAPWEALTCRDCSPLLLLRESKVTRTPSTGIISPERGSVGARGAGVVLGTQHGGQAWHTGQNSGPLCPAASKSAGSGRPTLIRGGAGSESPWSSHQPKRLSSS